MANDQKISALTAQTTVAATDQFVMETAAGATKKITGDNLGVAVAARSLYEISLAGQGLLSETFNRQNIGSNTAITSGTVYYSSLPLRKGMTATSFVVLVAGAGVQGGTGLARVGLYNTAGTLLASSADVTSTFTSGTGVKVVPFSVPYAVLADGLFYAAMVTTFASSQPALFRMTGSGLNEAGNAVGSGARAYSVQTGQTDLPSTATFGVGTATYWFGIT